MFGGEIITMLPTLFRMSTNTSPSHIQRDQTKNATTAGSVWFGKLNNIKINLYINFIYLTQIVNDLVKIRYQFRLSVIDIGNC